MSNFRLPGLANISGNQEILPKSDTHSIIQWLIGQRSFIGNYSSLIDWYYNWLFVLALYMRGWQGIGKPYPYHKDPRLYSTRYQIRNNLVIELNKYVVFKRVINQELDLDEEIVIVDEDIACMILEEIGYIKSKSNRTMLHLRSDIIRFLSDVTTSLGVVELYLSSMIGNRNNRALKLLVTIISYLIVYGKVKQKYPFKVNTVREYLEKYQLYSLIRLVNKRDSGNLNVINSVLTNTMGAHYQGTSDKDNRIVTNRDQDLPIYQVLIRITNLSITDPYRWSKLADPLLISSIMYMTDVCGNHKILISPKITEYIKSHDLTCNRRDIPSFKLEELR